MLGEHGLKHTWDNISDVYTPAADTGDCGTLVRFLVPNPIRPA